MEQKRQEAGHRPVEQRIGDFFEIDIPLPEDMLVKQASRCMDCGIPFCHGAGCPLQNRMPEFNDLVYRGRWREASENIHTTNNFPEITGRICPALCEAACTLNISDEPVTIKHIEYQIAERAWAEGWIKPQPPMRKSGRRVAVIGSGPAGLACAQQLAREGHAVTVFEKDEQPGGLLRLGIPDFKLEKRIIDRRIKQMMAEGVEFQTGVAVGEDISARYLRKFFDAICLTMGAGDPRDLAVPGRKLDNVHYAMDFLACQNRINAGLEVPPDKFISARDRVVIVIGGGDTGSDCVGTSRRQGAKDVFQLEIMPEPPKSKNTQTPWPNWPRILRTSSSHEEGCTRLWSVTTKKLVGVGTRVSELVGCEVEWVSTPKGMSVREKVGTEFTLKADLVLLAMGFTHVAHGGLVSELGLKLDERGNIVAEDHMTSEEGIFAAGDTIEGASLVVRAISSGRKAAAAIDRWLKK